MLDSETTQRTPALLDCRILATVLFTAGEVRRTPTPLVGASRCDGGPDCAMPCRQEGPGSSTCKDVVYLDLGWNDAAGAPRSASNVIPGVRLIDAQRVETRYMEQP
jgi:hypothetical protein